MAMGDGDHERRRKTTMIVISSIFLVATIVAVTMGMSETDETSAGVHDSASTSHVTTTKMAVKDICAPVKYKKTCQETLAKANTTDPRELIRKGFEAAKKQLSIALKNSTALQKMEKDAPTSKALKVCNEVLDLAIADLTKAFNKMGKFELSQVDEYVDDVQTWLSGAVTYRVTCLDAFGNGTSSAKKKMEKALKTAEEINTNALGMVNKVKKVIEALGISGKTTSRRLLGTTYEIPSWVDAGKRRLLVTINVDSKKIIDLVVAKDGSGNFTSLNEAMGKVPVRYDNSTFVIQIKEGVYAEKVMIPRNQTHLILIGDGPDKTIFTGSLNFVDGTKTMYTAAFTALGDNFMAINMGFENTAGAIKEQAVALRVGSDMSIFYNCSINGYQDTLYAHAHRQFYYNCTISGTVDFIFGGAAAVFQNCLLLIRQPLPSQNNMITAHGRTEPGLTTGIVIHNCTISGEPDYIAVKDKNKSYLGRPWKAYARTLVMDSRIDDVIDKIGWAVWPGQEFDKTCWFGEYGNRGPGAVENERVAWVREVNHTVVVDFFPENFIHAD